MINVRRTDCDVAYIRRELLHGTQRSLKPLHFFVLIQAQSVLELRIQEGKGWMLKGCLFFVSGAGGELSQGYESHSLHCFL